MDWEKEGKRALVIVRNVYKGAWKIKATASFIAELLLYGQKSVCVSGWFVPAGQSPSRVQLFAIPWTAAQSILPSTPGLPAPHPFPKLAQVPVHCTGDASQPSHPLMPSYLSAFWSSQHQGLFQWVICLHQMTKIPELQLQHQSFQWIFWVDLPGDWLVCSPCCPRDFQECFSSTIVQRHQFFGVLPSLWSSSHNYVWPLGRP